MSQFLKSKDDVLKEFSINPQKGLDSREIEERRKKYGANEFSPAKKTSIWEKILEALKEPMTLILIIAAIITIGINIFKLSNGHEAEFGESIGIIIAIALSAGIQIIMESKSEAAFEALNNINDDIKVKVIRNNTTQYITKSEVVVGDIVALEAGDKIPADGRLIDSLELQVDESMLTGESEAVDKDFTVVLSKEKTSLAERVNMVYGGTFVTYGKGTFLVTAVGDSTEMGNIANELKGQNQGSTPLQEKLEKMASKISFFGGIGAFLIFLFECYRMFATNSFTFDNVQEAFVASIALIVALVPEGLPTIVAMILAFNIAKMAKNNALVKKMVACETIGSINVICSDKTGTLTKNQMTVMHVWERGRLISPEELKGEALVYNFCINSTANLQLKDGREKFVGNPTECSLLQAFNKSSYAEDMAYAYDVNKLGYNMIREKLEVAYQYAFSSERKSMTTVVKNNNSFTAYSKGSPEKMLEFSKWINTLNGVVELDDKRRKSIEKEITKLQKEAYRIIGFSHRAVKESLNWGSEQHLVEEDMIFDGFVAIADPLREEVYHAVQKCSAAGIGIKILTGDNKVTASAIAKQLGILKEDSIVIDANEIDDLSDKELEDIIGRITVISRSKPLTKMRVVNLLKKMGNVVAVTGDGINDAPALKNADVGVAMGITGTEVSKESSDIVLLDDSFSTIVKAVEWGRGIYENLQRFIQFQLTVNVVAVLTIILSEIFGYDLPFTTTQLLWVNIIMDGPPALSLGLEALRKNLMNKTPVKRDENIITRDMITRIISNGVFIVIMLMLVQQYHILGGSIEQQSTIVFTTFATFQLFNAFNTRELEDESIFPNLLSNKVMLYSVGGTFIIQILVVQFAGKIFSTVPLEIGLWIKIILLSSTIILYSEFVKMIKKGFSRVLTANSKQAKLN
ncbi:calcium-translocating P-type ATPase, PMCA-type [Clostridium polyendosporum]|uniref:P-type Ca(2+) transporter n=1 Tax=Clostridium polyendosporum TaxID=69208 RepID=A0A919VDY2_9CLOT|nr:calcium-translocating P-type ATPase, PMCA-type [Clostridium polyendosporum]GIM28529.1 calcium-translocating P-type ATPase, PMCA-type [Clostridium polyendosporum]